MWALFLAAVCLSIILVVLAIHLLVVVTDLRNDGFGPADTCRDLNLMAPFDSLLQWLLSLVLLFSGRLFVFLWSLPFTLINIYLYYNRVPAAGWGYHNPLCFHRKSHLEGLSRLAIVKLIYHGVSVVLYLCCLIAAVIEGN